MTVCPEVRVTVGCSIETVIPGRESEGVRATVPVNPPVLVIVICD